MTSNLNSPITIPVNEDLPQVFDKFTPLHGNVLVLPLKDEEKKVGLIHLAGYESSFARGVVIDRGPGRRLESGPVAEMEICRGDVVFYSAGSAADIRIEGDLFHLLSYESLVGMAGC